MKFIHNRSMVLILIMLITANLLGGCSSGKASARVAEKLELATKYISEAQYDKAILVYNEVIEIDNKNTEAYQGLGTVLAVTGSYDEAVTNLQKGVESAKDPEAVQMTLAMVYLQQGDNESAEKLYLDMLNEDNNDIRALKGLAGYYISQGLVDKARSVLTNALEDNTDLAVIHELMARIYAVNGEMENAFNEVLATVKIDANYSDAYKTLLVLNSINTDLLSQLIDQAKTDYPLQGILMHLYILLHQDNNQAVVDLYTQNDDLLNQSAQGILLNATALNRMGDRIEALEKVQAISIKEKYVPGFILDVAELMGEMGQSEKAQNLAEMAITMDSSNPRAYMLLYRLDNNAENLAQALVHTGDYSEMLHIMGSLSQHNSKSEDAQRYFQHARQCQSLSDLLWEHKFKGNLHDRDAVNQYLRQNHNAGLFDWRQIFVDCTGDGQEELIQIPESWGEIVILQSVVGGYRTILNEPGGKYGNDAVMEGMFLKTYVKSGGTGISGTFMNIYRWNGQQMVKVSPGDRFITDEKSNAAGIVFEPDWKRELTSEIKGSPEKFEYILRETCMIDNKIVYKGLADHKDFTWQPEKFRFQVVNRNKATASEGLAQLKEFARHINDQAYSEANKHLGWYMILDIKAYTGMPSEAWLKNTFQGEDGKVELKNVKQGQKTIAATLEGRGAKVDVQLVLENGWWHMEFAEGYEPSAIRRSSQLPDSLFAVNGIRVGMSKAEVKRIAGEPGSEGPCLCDEQYIDLDYGEYSVYLNNAGYVTGIITNSLASGIKVGDSYSKLLDKYGQGNEIPGEDGQGGFYVVYEKTQQDLATFIIYNEQINWISIGDTPW